MGLDRFDIAVPDGMDIPKWLWDAVTEHVAHGRSTWAEGSCEPERFIVAGDKVIVLAHVRVRLKDHTEWIDGRIGDVFTFRNGRAIQSRTFAKQRETLEWAGVKG